MKKIEIVMYLGKQTPGTVRYEDQTSTAPVVPTVYVKKTAFPDGKYPESVRLTIEDPVSTDG